MILSFFILFLYIAGIIVTGGIIFYLIIKRIQNRGNEGFEERDN